MFRNVFKGTKAKGYAFILALIPTLFFAPFFNISKVQADTPCVNVATGPGYIAGSGSNSPCPPATTKTPDATDQVFQFVNDSAKSNTSANTPANTGTKAMTVEDLQKAVYGTTLRTTPTEGTGPINTLTGKPTLTQQEILQQSTPINTSVGADPKGPVVDSKVYVLLAPIEAFFPGGKVDVAGKGLGDYLDGLYKAGIAVATGLALVMIAVGGVQYVSTDAISGKSDGRQRIVGAVTGLLLALGSWLILQQVNPALLRNDLNIEAVPAASESTDQIEIAPSNSATVQSASSNSSPNISSGSALGGSGVSGASSGLQPSSSGLLGGGIFSGLLQKVLGGSSAAPAQATQYVTNNSAPAAVASSARGNLTCMVCYYGDDADDIFKNQCSFDGIKADKKLVKPAPDMSTAVQIDSSVLDSCPANQFSTYKIYFNTHSDCAAYKKLGSNIAAFINLLMPQLKSLYPNQPDVWNTSITGIDMGCYSGGGEYSAGGVMENFFKSVAASAGTAASFIGKISMSANQTFSVIADSIETAVDNSTLTVKEAQKMPGISPNIEDPEPGQMTFSADVNGIKYPFIGYGNQTVSFAACPKLGGTCASDFRQGSANGGTYYLGAVICGDNKRYYCAISKDLDQAVEMVTGVAFKGKWTKDPNWPLSQ